MITVFVALVLFSFAFIAYKLYFCSDNSELIAIFGWIISAVFTLRSVGDFNMVGFFKKIKDTEFAIYDTKYFSPLCLILGVIFATLTYNV
ncbi:DUF3995 domain-containing protein [Sulfurimonas sp.]|uniref:DUF3995 domain-containing protein n=1 Tax=Sulfurimonas sp. TaxID=2022749 RepID=UPI003567A7F5